LRLFLVLITTAFVLYVFNKFLLWLEANGWLYYKRRTAQGHVPATALLEMSKHLSPGNQHTIKMLQEPHQNILGAFKPSNAFIGSKASNDTEYHS
jgi:hypothetical protein